SDCLVSVELESREARCGVDLSAHELREVEPGLQALPLDAPGIYGLRLGEDREELARGIEHRPADSLAGQVLRRGDVVFLEGHDAGGGRVLGEIDSMRARRGVRVAGQVLDQRAGVAVAHVVGARGDALHGGRGAGARVNRHVHALLREITFCLRQEERRLLAVDQPVEREFHPRWLLRCALCRESGGRNCGENADGDKSHGKPPAYQWMRTRSSLSMYRRKRYLSSVPSVRFFLSVGQG